MREVLYQLISSHYTELLALWPMALLVIGLYIAVFIDPYIEKRERRIMLTVCTLVFSLVVENYLDYLLSVKITAVLFRKIVDIYGYSIRPVILLLFLCIVSKKKPDRKYWILVGANALIYLTALFSDICFTINSENRYQGGMPVLKDSCLFTSLLLLAMLLYTMLRDYRVRRHREILIPIFAVISILCALELDKNVFDTPQPITFLTASIVISDVLYYIWLHFQFVREHEDALAAQQRIRIMMTQIQPHFLYNTLATIRSLCQRSPETAARLIERFSRYLRQNLDAPNLPDLIPFRQELEHAQIYLEIETMMFPYIRVQYEIDDDQFLLPVLTLQPLVENAVRHGVRGRESGEILISTRKEADHHTIVIRDNGKGFVPDAVSGSDGTHIGIRNVRERLDKLCGGTLQIESTPGEGTTVTMIVPASRRKDSAAGTRVGRNHT